MELEQVNEGMKCPKCKKYTLLKSSGYEFIGDMEAIMWDYSCTNCKARFMDMDKMNKILSK